MSPYQFWAVCLAAIGWLTVGILVAQRARIGTKGKIVMPTCCKTNLGTDKHRIDWTQTEHSPPLLRGIVSLALLSSAPLVIINFNWNWLILAILIMFTLLISLIWFLTVPVDFVYLVEDTREPASDNQSKVNYKKAPLDPKKGDFITLAAVVAVSWLIFFGIASVVMGNTIRTGVLLAGFVLMVTIMYFVAKREQKKRNIAKNYVFQTHDYCERCGGKMQSKNEPRVIRENPHQSGEHIYYTQRTEFKVVKTCKICGMVIEL